MGERWIKVDESDLRGQHENTTYMRVANRWAKAEGQRVETIRWCTTHDCGLDAAGCLTAGQGYAAHRCVIVDATLILPPEAAS
jgi:hypothetical protein